MLGALVGLRQEARILRRILPDAPIAISNATPEGAEQGLARLLAVGVTELLSFGCAGGLSSSVVPGTVIVADSVRIGETIRSTDAALSKRFGRDHARGGSILHTDRLIATHEEKQWLYADTKCIAVDMESGVIANAGLPFAVLRCVCDDADRDLPPAASVSMRDGKIQPLAILRSILSQPSQIPALMTLGRDAAVAQAAMVSFLDRYTTIA